MNLYEITITYAITLSSAAPVGTQTITFYRRAHDRSTAISVASALFGRLSNVKFDTAIETFKQPCITIIKVEAATV